MSRSFVYAARNPDSGCVKIGWARNVAARMRAGRCWLPSVELLASGPGDQDAETSLHRRLRAHQVAGEWFEPHADVMAVVDALPFGWDARNDVRGLGWMPGTRVYSMGGEYAIRGAGGVSHLVGGRSWLTVCGRDVHPRWYGDDDEGRERRLCSHCAAAQPRLSLRTLS